jgi:hypothetical protein
MANLLADGGFAGEAVPPPAEAAWLAARSIAIVADLGLEPDSVVTMSEAELTELHGLRARLPPGSIAGLAMFGVAPLQTEHIAAHQSTAQSVVTAARAAVA